jgi:hypothetical protein
MRNVRLAIGSSPPRSSLISLTARVGDMPCENLVPSEIAFAWLPALGDAIARQPGHTKLGRRSNEMQWLERLDDEHGQALVDGHGLGTRRKWQAKEDGGASVAGAAAALLAGGCLVPAASTRAITSCTWVSVRVQGVVAVPPFSLAFVTIRRRFPCTCSPTASIVSGTIRPGSTDRLVPAKVLPEFFPATRKA